MIVFDEDKENRKLEDLRREEEETLIQTLSGAKYGMQYINLATVVIDNGALRTVTEKEAKDLEVAPFKLLGKNLHIALRSPTHPGLQDFADALKKKGFTVHLYMASKASLVKVWEWYKELSYATETKAGSLDISGAALIAMTKEIKNMEDVKKSIEATSSENKIHKISKILEVILAGAIAINASDVHIEPEENRVRLRYRLDGVLQDVMFFPFEIFKLINSRIKLLSGLKITMTSSAQDGRFSIFLDDLEISIRTSTVPGAYGEAIVMRLLNPKSIQGNLEDLGIEPKLFAIIDREIKKPNGMILITGPTGSGKTTTLYAFLRKIYSTEVNIITIEDPIEYHLEGITQTQTEKKYTFVEGLRAALRQDPDIIMVGEIRDDETAKIAVESALTGHLVFSSLHTNNAAGVIPRLIDLGVNPKILVSALSLSIAQRLVRKLCPFCKKERLPNPEEEKMMRDILKSAEADGKDLSFYKVTSDQAIKLFDPVGCDKCNISGFKGRLGVFEAIITDENIEKIIIENPSEREIKRIARKQGVLNMQEDGVIKVMLGITSLEELRSVVDLIEN